MDDEEIARIHQHKAWGFPRAPKGANTERQSGLTFLYRRRNEARRPATLDAQGDSWAYASLLIPPLDYAVLIRSIPELNSKDAEIRTRAWKKFACSDAARPYRVDSGIGRRKPNSRIIVK